jgi:hypothetical protein
MAEAKNDMGELAGREAVDGGASPGVVADNGEGVFGVLGFCGGGGKGGREEQDEQASVHNHGFVMEKYD